MGSRHSLLPRIRAMNRGGASVSDPARWALDGSRRIGDRRSGSWAAVTVSRPRMGTMNLTARFVLVLRPRRRPRTLAAQTESRTKDENEDESLRLGAGSGEAGTVFGPRLRAMNRGGAPVSDPARWASDGSRRIGDRRSGVWAGIFASGMKAKRAAKPATVPHCFCGRSVVGLIARARGCVHSHAASKSPPRRDRSRQTQQWLLRAGQAPTTDLELRKLTAEQSSPTIPAWP